MDDFVDFNVKKSRNHCRAVTVRFIGAVVPLVGVVVVWITMTEMLQNLFTRSNYHQHYFVAYWIHSSYALLYVLWKIWREFPCQLRCNRVGDGHLTWKRALGTSAIICAIQTISTYLWYLSLLQTSVPANTAIFQSSVAFVFILSVPILKERVTVVKIIGVLGCVIGVTLIAVYSQNTHSPSANNSNSSTDRSQTSNSDQVHQSLLGYVFLLSTTILYAVYEVIYKRLGTVKNDPAAVSNTIRMIGLVGVHTLLWTWPPILILHFTGIEPFQWPSLKCFQLMSLNAALDMLFNIFLCLSISFSSPTFASIGTLTVMPVSVVVDYFIKHKLAVPLVYIGMALIAASFLGFCISQLLESHRESKQSENNTLRNAIYKNEINNQTFEGQQMASTKVRKLRAKSWRSLLLKYLI